MNTGQTMLTIAALALLSVITMRYYSSVGNTAVNLSETTGGFTATTIATSFIERAQNLAFDHYTDTMRQSSVLKNKSLLTTPILLGREVTDDTDYAYFDDFDDFNNIAPIEYTPPDSTERYAVTFRVYYVEPSNINTAVDHQTFLKRMDVMVWRTIPPPSDTTRSKADTARMTTFYGYYKFNPI
ncbi:MAG: hypothetical protein EHM64_01670 [Ignavibacteriae bacterium]|nr:MAG: hypothetical protein EHM64_01670 [Ignavibacteriota bacterium]